jgi:3-methyladenine DNA glycosylase Mpg
VDYAGEHKDLPWRFYIKGNACVSRLAPGDNL